MQRKQAVKQMNILWTEAQFLTEHESGAWKKQSVKQQNTMPALKKPRPQKHGLSQQARARILSDARARWSKRKAAAAASDNGPVSPQNGAKNSAASTNDKLAPATAVKLLDAAIERAAVKAGVSVADFKKLPARDQNAYLAEQRGAKTAEGTEPGVQYYDPALIDLSPFNRTYFDEGKNAELIESVRIYGVAQNGIGRPHPTKPGRIELVAGQRRWNAAKITKRPMPLKVMPMTDEQAIELQAVENLHREDLSPIDEAVKYQQLIECYGKRGILKTAAVDMVSEKLKVSVSGIHASLKLLKLPDEVQEAVREMRLPPSHADLLGKLEHDQDAQKLAARQILNPKRSDQSEEGVMSFREAKRLVDHELEKMENRTAFNKLRDEFVRKGDLVLSAADNAKLFVHEGNPWHLTHNSGFVKPDEYCNEFNCDTWKKACGKNAPDLCWHRLATVRR